jgi:CHAD domain-containing protein
VKKDPSRPSALLGPRLQAFRRVLSGVEAGDDRAIHKARVASRRLRELIPILQLDPRTARKLGRRLRKVTRRLGKIRELDVLLLLTDELHVSRPTHRDALRRVRDRIARERTDERRLLPERVPIDSLWRLARRLDRVADELRERESADRPERRGPERARPMRWAIDARIAHRAARLARAVDAAGAVYLPERLHDVRIAVKKLRYALELRPADRDAPPLARQDVRATAGKAARTESRRAALSVLKRAQTLLGRMHDLQILTDQVRGAQASLAPPTLNVWRGMDALVLALDEACRRLHARYVCERPGLEAALEKLQAPSGAATRRSDRRVG